MRSSIFEKEKKCKSCTFVAQKNVCVYHFLQAVQSHQSMCLYGPLYERSVGCSGKVQRDLLHRHLEPII